jgi:adenosylmethionine---8-amino-7-oxononanoate aminotransferase
MDETSPAVVPGLVVSWRRLASAAMTSPLATRDLDVVWHPCTQMSDHAVFPPLEIVAAQGGWLTLADGRRVFDAISSWWCKSLGHGHAKLTAALTTQAERFEHVILANTTNEPVVTFCERLLSAANGLPPHFWGNDAPRGRQPGWFGKVFFADNGSTAVEVALKLALQAQAQRGHVQRTRFAALQNGYHGETIGALSVGDCGLYKDTFAPLLFPCTQLGPLPYRSGPEDPRWMDSSPEWPAIQTQLEAQADKLAAIVYEPVLQGAGGMLLYSPDLLRRLRRWADAHGVLLIADEIASGMGRCGAMLASHLAGPGVLPDLAVLSKGLTGGFLPLATVLTTDALYDTFLAEWRERRAFLHSNTYAGNALAIAVAIAALEVYASEDILGHVARTGPMLRQGLATLAREYRMFSNVRGLGMMAATDLRRPDGGLLDPAMRTGWRVFRAAVERGALLRPLGDTSYLFPPLNTGADDIQGILDQLCRATSQVLRQR